MAAFRLTGIPLRVIAIGELLHLLPSRAPVGNRTFASPLRRSRLPRINLYKGKILSRPKLTRTTGGSAVSTDDYRIYVTARRNSNGSFNGELIVQRATDGKIPFPFDGAPAMGPFATMEEARVQSMAFGRRIVAADLATPET